MPFIYCIYCIYYFYYIKRACYFYSLSSCYFLIFSCSFLQMFLSALRIIFSDDFIAKAFTFGVYICWYPLPDFIFAVFSGNFNCNCYLIYYTLDLSTYFGNLSTVFTLWSRDGKLLFQLNGLITFIWPGRPIRFSGFEIPGGFSGRP